MEDTDTVVATMTQFVMNQAWIEISLVVLFGFSPQLVF